jgi:hypothetical protein
MIVFLVWHLLISAWVDFDERWLWHGNTFLGHQMNWMLSWSWSITVSTSKEASSSYKCCRECMFTLPIIIICFYICNYFSRVFGQRKLLQPVLPPSSVFVVFLFCMNWIFPTFVVFLFLYPSIARLEQYKNYKNFPQSGELMDKVSSLTSMLIYQSLFLLFQLFKPNYLKKWVF